MLGLLFVGTPKSCTVSFKHPNRVRHAVEVGAETLYEAAVLTARRGRDTAFCRGEEPERHPHLGGADGRTTSLDFLQPKRREESRRGRHECLRPSAEYTLSRLPRWQSYRRALRNIVRNTG